MTAQNNGLYTTATEQLTYNAILLIFHIFNFFPLPYLMLSAGQLKRSQAYRILGCKAHLWDHSL